MSHSINKFTLIFAALSVLGISYYYASTSLRNSVHRTSGSVTGNGSCGYAKIDEFRRKGWLKEYRDPPFRKVSAVESNAVAEAFSQVREAYVAENPDDMALRMSEIPDIVMNLSPETYYAVVRDFFKTVDNQFLRVRNLREFRTVDECRGYLNMNLAAARFLGGLEIRRQRTVCDMSVIECRTYRTLCRYKEEFHSRGDDELESCVDSFLKEWISQIESPKGFTRLRVFQMLALQFSAHGKPTCTEPELMAFARMYAKELIQAGYTPEWLKEFGSDEEAE